MINRHSRNQSVLSKGIRVALMLLLLHSSLLAFSSVRAASHDDDDDDNDARPGNIQARGCFTCDFTIPAGPFNVAPVIERDRMYMAARPGMQRKQIPLRNSVAGAVIKCRPKEQNWSGITVILLLWALQKC